MTTLLLVTHGILGAALVVASVLAVQARTSERTAKAAGILLILTLTQTLTGDLLYPIYLRDAKPVLVGVHAGGRSVADVFEVKEHLAFFALVLAAGAFVSTYRRGGPPGPLVRVLVAGAHAAILLVATLGLVVASVKLP